MKTLPFWHPDGLVEKLEYQTKKKELLREKVVLEEKRAKLTEGAMAWLELSHHRAAFALCSRRSVAHHRQF